MTMEQARRNPTSTPKRSRPLWHVTRAEIDGVLRMYRVDLSKDRVGRAMRGRQGATHPS